MKFAFSKIVLIHLFLLVLFINNPLFPQEWRLAKGTEGIPIAAMDIYYSNPDTLYAIGDKFLISTDNGETWDSLCSNFWYLVQKCNDLTDIGAIKIDPFNSQIIYVSHYGIDPESNDVHMTTDGGKTWKLLFVGQAIPAPFIEVDPIDKHTIYIVQGPELIHRSSDNFQSWETIFPNIGLMTSFVIAPSDNNIFYAGYLSSIAKTTDKGKSWVKLPFPVQFSSGVTLAVDPKNPDVVYAALYSYGLPPGGMYKSVDGGQSWKEINQGLNSGDWDILGIFIHPQDTKEIFIGTLTKNGSNDSVGVFKAANDGWVDFNNGIPGGIRDFVFDGKKDKLFAYGVGIFILDSLITSVEFNDIRDTKRFNLYQNYPNPFNPSTTIRYSIPKDEHVKITIYSLLGEEIVTLVDNYQVIGIHEDEFNANFLASGVYIYRIMQDIIHYQ